MAHADMPEAVDDALVGQDVIGIDEVLDRCGQLLRMTDGHLHCAAIPAALASTALASTSPLTNWANSACGMAMGSTPSCESLSSTALACIAFCASSWSLPTIAAGVCAG